MLSRRAAITLAVAVAVVTTVQAARAEGGEETAAELVRRVVESTPKVTFVADALLVAPGGFERTIHLAHKQQGETEATYMEVTAPLNLKDTRFLFLERVVGNDEQYVYLPALKRTIQVQDDARKQPFLGSDFYVSDLVSPDVDAFTYSYGADVEVAGRTCKLVESVPKNPQGELYSKVALAVDPADLLVVRSEFFDPKGGLLKTWTLEKVEKIDGYWTPLLQKMTNLQQGSTSKFEIREVKYGVEVSDETFTKSYLQR